ncbi:MAG TPA: Hsp70 family protein [Acidimicrobiales bacterium]|nr:Hsp70 family protein [Acidimicrobiales bacterium]
MSYSLGVDLGTSVSAAAVEKDGRVRPCALADAGFTVPSIVLPRDDGRMLIGEPAALHGGTPAVRLVRLADHAGDAAAGRPAGAGGAAARGEEAMALLLVAIVDQVTAQEGARPRQVVIAQPAAHAHSLDTPYGRLAARIDGDARLVPAPAAALTMVDRHGRIVPGTTVAVLELGGDVADVTLVRRAGGGLEMVGRPAMAPGIGGAALEAILLDTVDAALDGAVTAAVRDLRGAAPGLERLRTGCRHAASILLTAGETSLDVDLPGVHARVRLTARDLQRLVEPRLNGVIAALARTVAEASLTPAELGGVVLVGGPARLPLTAELVTDAFGLPVSVDHAPELSVAFGAALLGSSAVARRRADADQADRLRAGGSWAGGGGSRGGGGEPRAGDGDGGRNAGGGVAGGGVAGGRNAGGDVAGGDVAGGGVAAGGDAGRSGPAPGAGRGPAQRRAGARGIPGAVAAAARPILTTGGRGGGKSAWSSRGRGTSGLPPRPRPPIASPAANPRPVAGGPPGGPATPVPGTAASPAQRAPHRSGRTRTSRGTTVALAEPPTRAPWMPPVAPGALVPAPEPSVMAPDEPVHAPEPPVPAPENDADGEDVRVRLDAAARAGGWATGFDAEAATPPTGTPATAMATAAATALPMAAADGTRVHDPAPDPDTAPVGTDPQARVAGRFAVGDLLARRAQARRSERERPASGTPVHRMRHRIAAAARADDGALDRRVLAAAAVVVALALVGAGLVVTRLADDASHEATGALDSRADSVPGLADPTDSGTTVDADGDGIADSAASWLILPSLLPASTLPRPGGTGPATAAGSTAHGAPATSAASARPSQTTSTTRAAPDHGPAAPPTKPDPDRPAGGQGGPPSSPPGASGTSTTTTSTTAPVSTTLLSTTTSTTAQDSLP